MTAWVFVEGFVQSPSDAEVLPIILIDLGFSKQLFRSFLGLFAVRTQTETIRR